MVYIFFVQSGTMMTFDNEISIMQSVADLKVKIEEKCHIPIDQQVLLINGGEPLDSKKNLCSYVAGTDSNPIYLFSTNYDITKLDILKHMTYDDLELKQRLAEAVGLSVSVTAVKIRALVAQDFYNVAKLQMDFCENMVLEQHLQQQGWSAVIANLEDIVTEFRKRWDLFQKMYEKFISDRDTYETFLLSFEEDKKILQRIPVIATLLETPKETIQDSEISETSSETKEISLYDWISSSDKDSKSTLDDVYELCKANLKKFEVEIMPMLRNQIKETLQQAERQERKEIEGLGKRLMDLDELLRKMKRNVEHQSDMAQSFLQNQNSVAHIKDTSVLPDLCATHVQQLDLIRNVHQKLCDDRTRIVKAKNELSKSLCARIGWVQNVEDKIWELDSLLVYFHEHLLRLRKHLEVFQQLHLAPGIYMNAVVEVVRRRAFSQLFLTWATDLSYQQLAIHNEEVTRRKEFCALFEGHFLNALFPGMTDVPPAFATEPPATFDTKLPKVDEEDIERLKKEVPDFTDSLALHDISQAVSFFLANLPSKEKEDKVDEAKAIEEKLILAVSDVGLSSNLDRKLLKAEGSNSSLVSALPPLKDDKGCESETDTDEFEKVGQSPLELTFPQSGATAAAEKIDASTSTEDNLQISRSEHEKLKSVFASLSDVATVTAKNLRADLDIFKTQFMNDSRELTKQYEELGNSWENLLVEVDRNEKEIVESLKRENEEEKEKFRYRLLEKEDVIRRLEEDKRAMEDRIDESRKQLNEFQAKLAQQNEESSNQIKDLKTQLHDKELEKEKCLKELGDNLKMEHRAELDNIKSRFKLMTMERSPSLTSLEKDKSGDFTSSSLLVQMTENFELDKENAVTEERQRGEKLLEEKINELRAQFEQEKQLLSQDLAKKLNHEKEKQIEILMQREKNLVLENLKFKTTIQQLTECQEDRGDSELYEQIEKLKMENEKLEKVLANDKQSPETSRKLNIDSCKVGDIVLLLWDSEHACFKVLQASKQLCFLNWDCLPILGLEVTDGNPNKMHCFGEVVNLEYCATCKDVNRYNVPRGSKFYMVKVKPVADLSRSQCIDEPVEVLAQTVEKQLAGDSGIVEEAAAADEEVDRHEEKFWSTQYIPEFFDKEKQYQLEISQYKNTIKELTESQRDRNDLRRDNELLQEELAKMRNEKEAFMTTSVAVCEAKLDATTSPLAISPPGSDMSRSDIFIGNRPHRLCIDSCKVGNVVLVIWDQAHENFKILQESKHTYFLHSDCLDKLGLCIVDGCPNKTYCIGEVVDKEYCQTRKSENRYKVPKGTKFFRVRVKPVSSVQRDSRELAQSAYTPKQSTSMSTSQSVITTFDPLIEEPRLDDVDISREDESEELKQGNSEDGGIEEATVATEQSERYESDSCKEMVESTYISTNWLEAMFRSMFSK